MDIPKESDCRPDQKLDRRDKKNPGAETLQFGNEEKRAPQNKPQGNEEVVEKDRGFVPATDDELILSEGDIYFPFRWIRVLHHDPAAGTLERR